MSEDDCQSKEMRKQPSYEDRDPSLEETTAFLSEEAVIGERVRRQHRNEHGTMWPWKIATGLLGVLSICLTLLLLVSNRRAHKHLLWVESDFPAAREHIELQQVQFYGNTAFYDNATGYVPNPPPIQYFGDPSEEVDANWKALAGERDFLISEEEAKALWPTEYHEHWDESVQGYPIGLDMFHTLHCINDIRKLFHPDYYHQSQLPFNQASMTKHRDHCLDQLRQYVMCAGDMTAYGSRYYSGIGRNYADSDVVHTCRNFEKLRAWTSKRYHAGGKLHMPGVEAWESGET